MTPWSRRRWAPLPFLLLLLLLTHAPSRPAGADTPPDDACSALLQAGLYDTGQEGLRADLERVRRWLVDTAAPSHEAARTQAEALGVDPRILALGLDGESAARDWRAWRTALAASDLSRLQVSPLLEDVATRSGRALRAALERCVERPGAHLWTESSDDPAAFRIHMRWTPPAEGHTLRADAFSALQGEGRDAVPAVCDPPLPNARRLLLLKLRPVLADRFVSQCRRADPTHAVDVRLAGRPASAETRLAAWRPQRTSPVERAVPELLCAMAPDDAGSTAGFRLTAVCPGARGDVRDRAVLDRWDTAPTGVTCWNTESGSRARATLRLACSAALDGSATVELEGELQTRSGGAARISGEARSELFVDVNAHHCAVLEQQSRGRSLRLLRPDGVEVAGGTPVRLEPPGAWQIVASLPADWETGAGAGRAELREALRLQVLQARLDGSCDGS